MTGNILDKAESTSATSFSLLVYGDEEVSSSIRRMLYNHPFNVESRRSLQEAMNALKAARFDVIISNLRMGDYSGLELMREAGTLLPSATRILVSGFQDELVIAAALEGGIINHFIRKPWDNKVFINLLMNACERHVVSQTSDTDDALEEFGNLPSPPRLQIRLNEILNKPEVTISQLVDEIELSPSLVARLLRIANSVHIGVRKRIVSVREAVLFVGTEYVASLVAALEAFGLYSANVPSEYLKLIETLEIAATKRAMIARDISSKWPGFDQRYAAYLVALLQDIGIYARICFRSNIYAEYLELKKETGLPSRQIETRVFGKNSHEKVSAAILERWNFPREVVDTVRSHHTLETESDIVRITQLATMLGDPADDYPHDESLNNVVDEWRTKLGLRSREQHPGRAH